MAKFNHIMDLEVLRNKYTQVSVTNAAGIVVGFLSEDVGVQGNSEWESLFDTQRAEAASGTIAKITTAGSGVADLISRANSSGIANISLKGKQLSTLRWTGSQQPTFTTNLKFIATQQIQDCRVPVAKLMQAVYPSQVSQSILGKSVGIMRAPLGYNGKGGGLTAIKIGTWFRYTKFILEDVNFTFSKQVIKGGNPLFAEGTISYKPYQALTFDDFLGMIGVSRSELSKSFYTGK